MTWGEVFPIFLSVILLASTLHFIISDAEAISWYDETWKFRKTITIDHAKISGISDLSNFPVLISMSNDPDLKSNNVQSNGDDIFFTASDGITKLYHETESFNNDSASGNLVAWVKVPTLYYTSDTVIYMYYGKSNAPNQQNSQSVWDSNYRAVWHLKESGVGSSDDFKDSTSNLYDGKGGGTSTQIPTKTLAGKIGSAQDFDGSNDYIVTSKNVISELTKYTISFWINSAANTANDMVLGENHSSQRFAIQLAGTSPYGVQFVKNGNIAVTGSEPTSGTWHHYALVWDKNGGSNNAKWYRNGNLDAQATVSGNMGSLTGDLVIGGDSQSNTWYDAIIDEMRISNVIRSADWIKTEFNNQNSPSGFYTITSPSVPSAPLSLSSVVGNTQISLSWSAPSNDGNSPITDYTIQYSSDSGSNWITFNDGTSTSASATVTGLTNGQAYLFRVYAVNSVGSSSSSNILSASLPSVPSAPLSLSSVVGNTQISLSWSAPSNDGNSPITDYTIQYSSDSGSNWITFNDGTSTSASATVTGLTNGQAYLFRVYAVNSVGSSSSSNILTIRPSANTNSMHVIGPPLLGNSERATMESKGLSPGFILPSSSTLSSSNFDLHNPVFDQYLKFTAPTSADTDMSTLISDYSVPQYSKPSNWDNSTVWAVPPTIIPVSGDVGEAAVYRINEITEEKPIFLPFTGADALDNGGKLNGITFTLASGKTANNLNVVSKFLKEPPPGVPEFSEADLYLSFDFATTENIDFGSTETFAVPPMISFVMGPIANSADPNFPINTVNDTMTCPKVQVPLISGNVPTTSGISVLRDTSGDTNLACGYTATLQHFSDYFARSVTSTTTRSSGNSCSDCEPPSFTRTFSEGEFPLQINENGYNLPNLQNKLTPVSIITGKSVDLTIRIYENKGPQNVQHVGLYTEFPKYEMDPAYANTAITWDKNTGISLHDPNHNIQNYDVITNINDDKFEATFNITFDKPMGVEDIVIRTWDERRNSVDTTILSALNITDHEPDSLLKTKSSKEKNIQKKELFTMIKQWGGFDVYAISDSELLHAIGIDGENMPHWFKKIAKWVVLGQLDEQDLVAALKFMHEKELLR